METAGAVAWRDEPGTFTERTVYDNLDEADSFCGIRFGGIPMGESQNIEWKELWRDEYLKWICGFANAQGGKIYIGTNFLSRSYTCRNVPIS